MSTSGLRRVRPRLIDTILDTSASLDFILAGCFRGYRHRRGETRTVMRKTVLRALAMAVVLSPAVTFTQSGKTKPTTATYISKEEVDIVNSKGQGIDRNIKVVDIGHENFTVGIIHRGKTAGGVAVPSGGAAAAGGRAGAPASEPCGRQMAALPPGGTDRK